MRTPRVTGVYLKLMDMRRVAERLQLLGDPEGPVTVAARVADENVGHFVYDTLAEGRCALDFQRSGGWALCGERIREGVQ
jgi:hypothetical protein